MRTEKITDQFVDLDAFERTQKVKRVYVNENGRLCLIDRVWTMDWLQYRIGLMERFPAYEFDLDRLTCCATHGDYFISQIICGEETINAVIDWTTAISTSIRQYFLQNCSDGWRVMWKR